MKLPSVSATVELLEGQELEGNLDAAGFNLLLAHYLLNFHHLRDAQLLWKRIPEELKVADGEMCRIWQVGQCLLAKNVSQLYQLGEETPWSPPVQPLMSELMEVVRRR